MKLKLIIFILIIINCNSVFSANHNITLCPSTADVQGDTYYLNTSISIPGFDICLRITNNSITLDCQNHSITGSSGAYGINVQAVNNITIKNCKIEDFQYGIRVINSFNNTIISNEIFDCENAIGDIVNMSNNNILYNHLHNNDYGIHLHYNNNIISHNNISSNIASGIRLEGDSTIITSNTIAGNDGYGILLYLANDNNISFNNISNNYDGLGISGSYNQITSNNISNNNAFPFICGISIYLDSGDFNTLTSNIINGNAKGLCLSHTSNNNTITNSDISNNQYNNIYLENYSGALPHDNTFSNNLLGNSSKITTEEGTFLPYNSNIFSGNTYTNYYGNCSNFIFFCDLEFEASLLLIPQTLKSIFPLAGLFGFVFSLIFVFGYLIFN